MDKFPEAFRRFENDVDISRVESYRQLTLAFRGWAGQCWKGTHKQWSVLNREAHNLGFEALEGHSNRESTWRYSTTQVSFMEKRWREEVVKIKGKSKIRYRDVKTGRFIKKP